MKTDNKQKLKHKSAGNSIALCTAVCISTRSYNSHRQLTQSYYSKQGRWGVKLSQKTLRKLPRRLSQFCAQGYASLCLIIVSLYPGQTPSKTKKRDVSPLKPMTKLISTPERTGDLNNNPGGKWVYRSCTPPADAVVTVGGRPQEDQSKYNVRCHKYPQSIEKQ